MSLPEISKRVLVCLDCSALEPINTPHYSRDEGPCHSRRWKKLPLVENQAGSVEVENPHADGGWPEIHVTTVFMVRSDDPQVIERVRDDLVEKAWAD